MEEVEVPLALLQAENAALRQDNEVLLQEKAALLEALRVAQLGGIDLQGHLSKFNPDAAEQGIFTQDWELRYFVLSGTLLKYYTSERDVGRQYRGVLALEGCLVEVEAPTSAKGPFVFDINDPDGDTLLRLSADKLSTAKTWIKTLHAVGLPVRGFRRLTAVAQPGLQPQQQQQSSSSQQLSFGRSLSNFGRSISGRWSSVSVPGAAGNINTAPPGNSLGSEVSMAFQPSPQGLRYASDTDAADGSHSGLSSSSARKDTVAAAAAAAAGSVPFLQQPSVGPPAAAGQLHMHGDDDDDGVILSSDDDENEQESNRRSRLRRRYRALKGSLHTMLHGDRAASATAAAGAAGAASPAGPSLTGGAAAAAGASTTSSSSGMAGGAAAAVSVTPFQVGKKGGGRHRRSLSAPFSLQKQVSWRFVDRGDDERPEFDLDDDDSCSDMGDSSESDDSDTATSTSHTQQQQAPQLSPAAGAGAAAAAAGAAGGLHASTTTAPVSLGAGEDAAATAAAALASGLPLVQHLEGIQEQDEEQQERPKRPQRISAFGAATEAAAIASAGGISDAVPDATAAAVHGPPTPPPAAGVGRSSGAGFKGGSVTPGSLKPQSTAVVKPKRSAMLGYSPVHVASKDSILTEHDRYGVMRHEGFLNLGVVVLLATNLRMIINNLLTYGLRMRVNQAVLGSLLLLPLARDDVITLLAIPLSGLLFALVALLIEKLGLMLLRSQEKMLTGLQKKDVPAAQITAQGLAASRRQEALLLLANLLNAVASLVLPCCLVLSNQASLLPGFILTVVAIVMSMKLATYAHCNTALRCEARRRAIEAAAAGRPVVSTPLQLQFTSTGGGGRGGSALWKGARNRLAVRSMLAPSGLLATAATHTAAAAAASAAAAAGGGSNAGSGSSPLPPSLRTSATDPSPFLIGLSRTASMSRRHAAAAGLTVGEVMYPNNLNARELAYYMVAPTLTYQLNFPRLRQRRWRLLSRWLLLAVLTAIAMSFMQVQFLLPCMQSSLMPLREMHAGRFLEQLLRLAMPNTAVWLAMFYLVFHLWLNILGELLMFGDRVFYKEWWNAATLSDYWKLWNIPVHKWMLRTIFFPLVRRGAPRLVSLLVVFLISAVMHELAVGVPLRMLRGWAFWGMMAQVPLITMTELLRKRLKADTLGNCVFWASFCVLGQPMCLVLYYHDWLLAYMGEQGWRAAAAQGGDSAALLVSSAVNGTLSSVAGSMVY